MNVLKKYFESTNQYRQHFLTENHNYKEGSILQFWYIVDQDSPGVKKFVRGLSALMDQCFPSERKDTDTVESDNSSLVHRYICVTHEGAYENRS